MTEANLRQLAHMFSECGDHGRRVLAGDLETYKARMAFNQRRDCVLFCSTEQVSFPMAGHGAVLGLGRPFTD